MRMNPKILRERATGCWFRRAPANCTDISVREATRMFEDDLRASVSRTRHALASEPKVLKRFNKVLKELNGL